MISDVRYQISDIRFKKKKENAHMAQEIDYKLWDMR